MRRLLAWFALVISISPLVIADSVRIATYNIRLKLASDDRAGNGWDIRRDSVRQLIQFHGFDIIGLQEALHPQWVDLLGTPGYTGIGVGRDDGIEAGEYSPILYRKDAFTLENNGTFWYSETPERPSFGWDAQKYRRICTWARLTHTHSGITFLILNSHFDHEAVVARRESAHLLLRKIKEIAKSGDHVFALGDFNSDPDSEPYSVIAAGLKDTRELSELVPYGANGTFNNFQHGQPADIRIDHIFAAGSPRILRHGTLADAVKGRYPSDHFPVFIDVAVP